MVRRISASTSARQLGTSLCEIHNVAWGTAMAERRSTMQHRRSAMAKKR
jgi:hypothetical protein